MSTYTEAQKAAFDEFFQHIRQPFFKSLIAGSQEPFPHAQIIEIPNGHHYCFIAQEDLVYTEMRRFLQATDEQPAHPTT